MSPEKRLNVEGVASIAITSCLMGKTDDDVAVAVRWAMGVHGMTERDDALLVAQAIAEFPVEDRPAAEQAKMQPIEDAVGLDSAEDWLNSMLRAREVVLELAGDL